jgi:hypothetical protein
VFLPVTFGSILEEDLGPILARMRAAAPAPVHRGCPSVLLHDASAPQGGLRNYDGILGEWGAALYPDGPARQP